MPVSPSRFPRSNNNQSGFSFDPMTHLAKRILVEDSSYELTLTPVCLSNSTSASGVTLRLPHSVSWTGPPQRTVDP